MPNSKPPITKAFLLLALGPPGGQGGDEHARREVCIQLHPVIHARVARVFDRLGLRAAYSRSEQIDLIHDVFLHLFDSDARQLRRWDPEREVASSLENYVGMIAETLVAGLMRAKKRSPRFTERMEAEDLDERRERDAPDEPSPEDLLGDAEVWKITVARVKRDVGLLGTEIFELRWEQGLSVDQICQRKGMSRGAVDRWMARIRAAIEKHRVRD